MTARRPPVAFTGQALHNRNLLIDSREERRCARCGKYIVENGSRHHRKYKGRGGGDEVSNGILLCGSGTTGCHGWAHSHPKDARYYGFSVLSHEDPRLVPVHHFLSGRRPVYLDNDGGMSLTPPSPEELELAA